MVVGKLILTVKHANEQVGEGGRGAISLRRRRDVAGGAVPRLSARG